MTNSEKYYVEKVAQAARKSVKNAGIQITYPMTFEVVKRITEHFGIPLIEDTSEDNKLPDFYLKKKGEKELEIYYKNKNSKNIIMKLLHELGHAFFDFKDMELGTIKGCGDSAASDYKADMFARAFIMPRDDFEKDMVKNTTPDGKFDMIELANHYGVEYMDTLARGEDLNFWH